MQRGKAIAIKRRVAKKQALEILLTQSRTVRVETENFSERAKNLTPKEFKDEFNAKVRRYKGFSAKVPKNKSEQE